MSDSSDSHSETLGSVLLSAGRGTRIRPLSDVRPKAALPLLDVPQGLPALLTLVARAPRLVVNLGHLDEAAADLLKVHSTKGVEALVETPEPYGTGGTLKALGPRLAPTVVTWNADLLTDLDPRHLVAAHRRSDAAATLAVTEVSHGADFERDGDRLTRLLDRRDGAAGPGARFIGMAVFERAALERLPDARPLGLTEGLLRPLAGEGSLACHVHDGYARDVGNIADYLAASIDLLNESVRVENFITPGRVLEIDGGRAYVGPRARVDSASLGRDAIVLEGAHVNRGAFVERAIVWPDESVPAGADVRNGVWFGGRLLPAGIAT
ncbi:MAG: NDP-sugar synthase [Actinomycetota bacterium]|nr:NDP-sugar synthase [Actinomycetota bacterium]